MLVQSSWQRGVSSLKQNIKYHSGVEDCENGDWIAPGHPHLLSPVRPRSLGFNGSPLLESGKYLHPKFFVQQQSLALGWK